MTVKILVGVALAFAAWAAMFAGGRRWFWSRAALAAAAIGVYAAAVDPAAIGREFTRPQWWVDLGLGVASGLVLYGVFWLGEQLLVVLLPSLAAEVGDLYQVKGAAHPGLMPLVLAVAAPGEEIFFRGFLWHEAGVAVALAVYGAVHIPERKVILVLAALVGGVWWGLLFAWTGGLVAPVASHLLWIFLIVVVKPARPAGWALRASARLRRGPART